LVSEATDHEQRADEAPSIPDDGEDEIVMPVGNVLALQDREARFVALSEPTAAAERDHGVLQLIAVGQFPIPRLLRGAQPCPGPGRRLIDVEMTDFLLVDGAGDAANRPRLFGVGEGPTSTGRFDLHGRVGRDRNGRCRELAS